MIVLPEEYIIDKFFYFSHHPKHNKYNNTYQASCVICREGGGTSFGKKKRCYYIPKNDNIYCHNCGWSGKPYTWIKQVSGKTDTEIITEIEEYSNSREYLPVVDIPIVRKVTDRLPKDSINLSDSQQLKFYSTNPVVSACLTLIHSRRLDTAVNRPDNLYLSLTDPVHKNRLVLPFKSEQGSIEFYQSRTIIPSDNKTRPKYVSRINAEKTLFNIDKVTSDSKNVFIFEGPINAFFTKNSVAVAGITEGGSATFTERQQKQVDTTLRWMDRIWVLDSQWIDNASLKKSETLLLDGENVFIWPEKLGKRFKDFNDIAIYCKIDEISAEFIQKNTFNSLEGIVRLSEIKKFNGQ